MNSLPHSNFNSIKVRLKRGGGAASGVLVGDFNSIKVRLKLSYLIFLLSLLAHFNSIKVRLKLNFSGIGSAVQKFQFHKGTIKTQSV